MPADPLVGAIFRGDPGFHVCTGAVLHSTDGDLILTAAHCLDGDEPATFAPGLSDVPGPAGTWAVDAVYLDPRWVEGHDPAADFAIARVSRDGAVSLESVVGTGLVLGDTPAPGTVVATLGYAAGVGGAPVGCTAAAGAGADGYPSLTCSGFPDGTSGSPWRVGSTVVGLIGGLDAGGCTEHVSYSPPFDGRLDELLRRAEDGGTADEPPEVVEGGCWPG